MNCKPEGYFAPRQRTMSRPLDQPLDLTLTQTLDGIKNTPQNGAMHSPNPNQRSLHGQISRENSPF